jgi:hypothetical protein
MRERPELLSNIILDRDLQSEKQRGPTSLTEEGMQIDESEIHRENAVQPISDSCASSSNATVEREWHSAKQQWPRRSTEAGMQNDESKKQCSKARSPIQDS